MKNNNINVKLINYILFLTFLSILGLFLYYTNLTNFIGDLTVALIPFFIGFFICWLMMPVSEFISKKFKIKSSIANFISIIISIIFLLGFFFVIVPLMILQIITLSKDLPTIATGFIKNLPQLFSFLNIDISHFVTNILNVSSVELINYLKESLSFITDAIQFIFNGAISFVSIIIKIILGYIIAFYFMGSMKSFVKSILNLTGPNNIKRKKLVLDMSKVLFSYIRGVIIISSFVAIIMTIGVSILGISSPLLFGIISGITNIIPYLGPVLGGIPLFIVALSMGINKAILSIVLILIVQVIESNLLQPKVMSKSVNLHPVTIIVGLLVLGKLFGIIGMIVATPVLSMVSVWLKQSKYKDKISI